MRVSRVRTIAILWFFAGLPDALHAQQTEQPVGLVVAAKGAKLRRADAESLLTAKVGDVLFSGDALLADGGAVTFLFCPESSSGTLATAGEILFETKQLKIKSGQITSRKQEPVCLLPPLERTSAAGQQHLGASLSRAAPPVPPTEPLQTRIAKLPDARQSALLSELGPIDKLISSDGRNLAAHVARAAVLERYSLSQDALEEYRKVQAESPDAVWVRSRLFVHEEAAAAAAPKPSADVSPGGKTYALLVGISKYQLDRITSLKYADEDAFLFDKHLKSPRGGGLAESDITLLADEKATLAAVRNAFDTLLKNKAGKQDTVLLFFAAHGTTTDQGVGYIITHDSDPQDLASTALPMREVQRLFREQLSHVGRVLLYVDVCHAGSIGTVQPKSNRINTLVENLTDEGEMFGMLASRKDEVAVEGPQFGGGHGAFSYFLLDALNGAADANNNGVVDAIEIVEYVSERVKDSTASRQHPKEIGNAGTATLAMTSKPGIPLQPYTGTVLVASRDGQRSSDTRGLLTPVTTASKPHDVLEPFNEALEKGRLLPDAPENAFNTLNAIRKQLTPSEYLLQENRLRVALENQGQQVLLRYLTGDQIPQTRADFLRGAAYFSAARLLTPESLLLEAREEFCLGRVSLFDKNYAKAADALERSIRLDNSGAYSYNALGISALEQARYEQAIPAFRDAVRRAPYWAYPLHNLALAYTQTGDYESAIRSYERAMRLAPRYSYLPYNLGLVYQRMNRRKEAEMYYRKAIELSPDLGEPYNALGYLKFAIGRPAEAEQLYRQALLKNSNLLAARHNLALVLAEDPQRFSEAVALWRENLAKSSDYLPSRLSLAKALARNGETAAAMEEYRLVLASKPDYTSARRALAELLIQAGKPEAALEQLQQALKTQPGNPLIQEQIGDAEKARGNLDASRNAYRTALQQVPDEVVRRRLKNKLKLTARSASPAGSSARIR